MMSRMDSGGSSFYGGAKNNDTDQTPKEYKLPNRIKNC